MTRDDFKALGTHDPWLFMASVWAILKGAWGINCVKGRQTQRVGLMQRPMTKALAFSLLFHTALIAGLFFSFGQRPVLHDRIIRISLVDEPSGGGVAGKAGGQEKAIAVPGASQRANKGTLPKPKRAVVSPPSVLAPSRQPAPINEAVSEKPIISREPVPAMDTAPPAPRTAAPDIAASSQSDAGGNDYAAKGGGIGGGAGYGTGSGSGGAGQGGGTGAGAGGSGAGSGQAAYLREHFVYIRDLIMKNLKYPEVARKLGWKGAVTVSFVVLESGAAYNIKVIKSSGHDILDKAVIKTIQETQPFPKPPVKAELTIPIVFRLEAGTG